MLVCASPCSEGDTTNSVCLGDAKKQGGGKAADGGILSKQAQLAAPSYLGECETAKGQEQHLIGSDVLSPAFPSGFYFF